MPEENREKGHGFSRLHKHQTITDLVHQWQGAKDVLKSHDRLYDMFNVELA